MKNSIEKYSVLLLVMLIFSALGNSFITPILSAFITKKQLDDYNISMRLASILSVVFIRLVDVALAVWVFFKAKQGNMNKWSWALLTVVFGIGAIILFYISQLLSEIKKEKLTAVD